MRIAFYAPIKPPDHPIPSGDRLIAGNLIKAMKLTGNSVELASRFIAYSKRSSGEILQARKIAALAEAAELIGKYQALPSSAQPEIWITYHPYCKAPDWIGPTVANALTIPYVTIEACKTGQGDQWLPWRAEAQAGIKLADLHLWFKPTDRVYLTDLLGSDDRLCNIPPFIDLGEKNAEVAVTLPEIWDKDVPVIVTVGMMRKGKKDRNFSIMADVLNDMQDARWNMVIVGGGPEEDAIRQEFSDIDADRLHWCGQVSPGEVNGWMKASDIFIWPGWKEPIGMVYLEAASNGLPVIAFDNMGVPLVVKHQHTGLLAELDNLDEFRDNLKSLLDDPQLRARMGKAARIFVREERSMSAAVTSLERCLATIRS